MSFVRYLYIISFLIVLKKFSWLKILKQLSLYYYSYPITFRKQHIASLLLFSCVHKEENTGVKSEDVWDIAIQLFIEPQ